jgi:hypothetical protein
MAASIWGAGGTLVANQSGTIVPQSFTGTAGQTLFTLTNFTYTQNTNSLEVFVNGNLQVSGRDYFETSSTTFTLVEGVLAGDFVDVFGVAAFSPTAVIPGSVSLGGTYTLQNYISDSHVNVKNYPYLAKGDGISDDTAAILAAIATNRPVYVPPGTYLVSSTIYLTGVWNPTLGLYMGAQLFGEGTGNTTIKAAVGFSNTYVIFIGNPNYKTDGKYSVQNRLEGITVDPFNQTDDVNHSGVYLMGTYNFVIRDLKIGNIQYPFNRWDLNLGRGVYEGNIDAVYGQQLQIASDTTDRVTDVNLLGGSWTFINIVNALGINFELPTIQGTTAAGYQANRVQITSCYNISFTKGDLEGSGTYFNCTDVHGLWVQNNNVASIGTAMYNLTNCSNVFTRDQIYMNWAPTQSQVYIDGSGNTNIQIYDLHGAYFEGVGYHASGSQTFATSTLTVLNFDVKDFDSSNLVTTGAAWKFLVPMKGNYNVNASLQLNATAGDTVYIVVAKNGVEYKRYKPAVPSTVVGGCFSLNVDVACAIGDTLDIRAFSNNATPTMPSAITANFVFIKLNPGS